MSIEKNGRVGAALRARVVVAFALAAVVAGRTPAAGQSSEQPLPPNAVPDVKIVQKLEAQVPPDLTFTDSTGREVRLSECFADKPIVLNLVYYECPMLCTLVLNGLVRALRAVELDVGEDFDVLTVSIDHRETPALAAGKKTTYLNKYARPGAAGGWHFMTGDEASIKRLADAVGFGYMYVPDTGEYAHAAGIMVLTPEGRVARYFYGVEYSPRDMRWALVEASENKIGSPADQLLLLCFHYDPTTGKYGLAIMNIMRLMGVLTLAGLGIFIVKMVRRDYRTPAAEAPADQDAS